MLKLKENLGNSRSQSPLQRDTRMHTDRPHYDPMTDDEWFALCLESPHKLKPSDWPRYEATRQDLWFFLVIVFAASLCAIVAEFLGPWSNYVLIPVLLDLGICRCFRKRHGQCRNHFSILITFPCTFIWLLTLFIPTFVFSNLGMNRGLAYLLLLLAFQLITLGREILEHYIQYGLHHHMLIPSLRVRWEKLRPSMLRIFRQQRRGRRAGLFVAPMATAFLKHVRLRRRFAAFCCCYSLLLFLVPVDEEILRHRASQLLLFACLLLLLSILPGRRWLGLSKPILVFLHSSKPSGKPSQSCTRDRRVFFFAHLVVAMYCLVHPFCMFLGARSFPGSVVLLIVPPALVLLALTAFLGRACLVVNTEFEDVGACGHTDEFYPYPADDPRHVPESEWLERRRLNAEFIRRNYRPKTIQEAK